MTSGGPAVEAILAAHGIAECMDEVGTYVVAQRWSGGRGMTVTGTAVADAAVLAEHDPALILTVTDVTFDSLRTRSYALPLGLRRAGDPLAERAPDYMIGTLEHDGHELFLYDAVGDPAYIHWLWRALRARGSTPTAHGMIRFECPDPDALEPGDQPSVRVLSAEQSNTSMIVGDGTFFKHLRRVEPGPSHELEMISALNAAGFTHLAPLLGAAVYEPAGEPATLLALVQPYLHNGTEGWSLALTSLRDLYADAEEAADPGTMTRFTTVEEQGGAFTGEAARLGSVTAEMHLALTRAGLGADVEPIPLDAALLQGWADTMIGELDALLARSAPVLDPLRAARDSVVARFDALRSLEPSGLCTRVHGDLHLGQTMRVDSGWVILDFEGEPDRTPAERRARTSPLRDVAGMLRSFDYAAAVALTDRLAPDSPDWDGMLAYGDAWAHNNRDAFWSAYLSAVGDHPLLPEPGTAQVVRRAFEVQKAVYEVGYELGHRPAWVGIPMRFLLRGVG